MVSATTKLEKLAVNRLPPLSRRQWNGWGQFRRRRHAICGSLCETDDPRVLAPVTARGLPPYEDDAAHGPNAQIAAIRRGLWSAQAGRPLGRKRRGATGGCKRTGDARQTPDAVATPPADDRDRPGIRAAKGRSPSADDRDRPHAGGATADGRECPRAGGSTADDGGRPRSRG